MNKDKLDLWLTALRSGDYQQGRSWLVSLGGGTAKYCCLGVACEVAIKDGVGLEVTDSSSVRSYDGETMFLPHKVQEWLGTKETPEVMLNGIFESVVDLNDSGMLTFDEIADALEATHREESK